MWLQTMQRRRGYYRRRPHAHVRRVANAWDFSERFPHRRERNNPFVCKKKKITIFVHRVNMSWHFRHPVSGFRVIERTRSRLRTTTRLFIIYKRNIGRPNLPLLVFFSLENDRPSGKNVVRENSRWVPETYGGDFPHLRDVQSIPTLHSLHYLYIIIVLLASTGVLMQCRFLFRNA